MRLAQLDRMRMHWTVIGTALLSACSSSSSSNGGGDDGSLVIASSAITLQAGEEKYLCWDVDVDAPFYAAGLDVDMPAGIHHYQVTVTPASGAPRQAYECSAGEGGQPQGQAPPAGAGGFSIRFLGVGGPSTPGVQFPDGTGMPLDEGARLVMQLHILNSSAAPRDYAPARAVVKKVAAGASPQAVGVLVVNDISIDVAAHTTSIAAGADCAPPERLEHVFALWPHMHLLGKHVSVTTSQKTLVDTDWVFDKQDLHAAAETIDTTDTVSVHCRYDNPTDRDVKFGWGTNDEMCAAFVYYWPSRTGGATCGGKRP